MEANKFSFNCLVRILPETIARDLTSEQSCIGAMIENIQKKVVIVLIITILEILDSLTLSN